MQVELLGLSDSGRGTGRIVVKKASRLAVAGWILAGAAWGQIASSTLTGVVRDASASVVPGARVTSQDQATGFRQTAISGRDGGYGFADLRPGTYTVTVEKDGFQKAEATGVVLAVNQHGRLDLELRPGSAPQSVTVTASVSPVQADDASVGFRTESASITNLPLLGRKVNQLVTLGPGTVPRELGGFVHDTINDIQPARGAVVLNPPIHGARSTGNRHLLDGTGNTDFNAFAPVIEAPLESVQEFRIITSLAAAEFPQGGGGVVNIVTKTGTREFHGSAFEFFRNEATDAKNYFDDPSLPRPILRRNQFGASLSGPVGLARTYFFATYEGIRDNSAKSSLNLVPDAALRSGNFGGRDPIYDPLTLTAAGTRTPFAANAIPSGRIDGIAKTFLERFQPLPNRTGAGSNYLDATPNQTTEDHAAGRLDHEFRNESRLFGRYNVNGERQRVAGVFPLLPSRADLRAQQALVGYTASRPGWLSETRLSFTRLRVFNVPESAFKENIAAQLGINGIEDDPFTYGLPYFLVTNFNLRTDDPILPQTQRDNLWQASETVSWTRGGHTWKAGGQITRFQLNYRQSQLARGRLTFTGALTALTGSTAKSGDAFADFLLGLPQNSERNVGAAQAYLKQNTWAGFVQDDWRVNQRLTVNLGMRYEYFEPMSEKRGALQNLDYSALPGAPKLVQVSQAVKPDRNNWAPRIGMALRLPKMRGPVGELVLRGGYGIYYSPEIATEYYDLLRNGQRNESNPTDGSKPVLTLRDPFPRSATTGLPGYFGIDNGARTPYIQQWTAGIQREFGQQAVLEVVYVGSKGTDLGRFRTFNTPQHVETGENLTPRPGDIASLRPFPNLGPIVQRQHIANSVYHGLEVKLEKRFSRRFSVLGSFAWAKSIDDADTLIPGKFQSFGAQDERNLRLERGLSVFDIRKRLAANVVYEIPGKHWLSRNWEVSGLVTLQDGTPLNPVYFAADFANSGTPNRPNVVAGQDVNLPRSQRTADRFFNTDAFSAPAQFTFGNAGRNILPGPGNVVLDVAVMRRFRLTEHASMQWRAESFNFPNHPNWGIPGPYPDFGPFFGKIFSSGDPRRFQFGARVDF